MRRTPRTDASTTPRPTRIPGSWVLGGSLLFAALLYGLFTYSSHVAEEAQDAQAEVEAAAPADVAPSRTSAPSPQERERPTAPAPSSHALTLDDSCGDYIAADPSARLDLFDGDDSATSAVLFACNAMWEEHRGKVFDVKIGDVNASYLDAVVDASGT